MSLLQVNMAPSNNKMSIETYKLNLFFLTTSNYIHFGN